MWQAQIHSRICIATLAALWNKARGETLHRQRYRNNVATIGVARLIFQLRSSLCIVEAHRHFRIAQGLHCHTYDRIGRDDSGWQRDRV